MNARLRAKALILWFSLCLAMFLASVIWVGLWIGLLLVKLERWIDSLVSAWKKSVVVGPDRRGEDLDKEGDA